MNRLRATLALLLCLAAAPAFADSSISPALTPPGVATEGNAAATWNVNSRYTVESVEFPDTHESAFSHRLRQQIRSVAGDKLNVAGLQRLARDIRSELNAHAVSFRIARGSRPDYVRVFFTVDRARSTFDVSVPKAFWQSNAGWTGVGETTLTAGTNSLTADLLSDGDDLIERFTGVRARVAHRWRSDRPLRLVLDFEDYREDYDQSTRAALAEVPATTAIYRARRNFAPRLEYAVKRDVTVSVGASFEGLESETPSGRSAAANALTARIGWRRDTEGADESRTTSELAWSLRAATRTLGSDYVYARNEMTGSFRGTWGRHTIEGMVDAGLITGEAPLFDRFALGNSEMLRGWNKFVIDPLGGTRMAYGSIGYRYRMVRVFYDTGAIWDPRQPVTLRQSVGAGVGSSFGILGRNEVLLAVAFPLQQSRMDPVFIAGMNF